MYNHTLGSPRSLARRLADVTPMDESARLRVLFVGELLLTGEALTYALGADPRLVVVGSVTTVEEAQAILQQTPLDVALLNGDGPLDQVTQGIQTLHGAYPSLKVLVLATQPVPDAVATYFRAGAIGCLPRDRSLAQLVADLQQAQQGALLFSPEQLVALATQRGGASREPLTPREQEVLQILARGGSTEHAAAALSISPGTLRTHLQHCMTKLGARSRVEAVVVALQARLIQLPEAESPDVEGYLFDCAPGLASSPVTSISNPALQLAGAGAGC
jgi:two-component system response regulator DesR